jgi:hypothetical protein
VLITVSGHFDLAKVRTVLDAHGAKQQMYNVQVFRRKQDRQGDGLPVARCADHFDRGRQLYFCES